MKRFGERSGVCRIQPGQELGEEDVLHDHEGLEIDYNPVDHRLVRQVLPGLGHRHVWHCHQGELLDLRDVFWMLGLGMLGQCGVGGVQAVHVIGRAVVAQLGFICPQGKVVPDITGSNFDTKYCRNCNTIKPHCEFTKNKQLKDGLYSKCKECLKQKNRRYYELSKTVKEIEEEIMKK